MRSWVVVMIGGLLGALAGVARGIWQVRPGQPSDGPLTALAYFTGRYALWGLVAGAVAALLIWMLSRLSDRP